jgi:Putative polyhydroxyalkanoic acid system protein (PHA_gran_rgn)
VKRSGYSFELVRITVSHTRSKDEVVRAIDHSFDDLFRGIGIVPIQFVEEHRQWQGSTLNFSVAAKMGLLSTPLKGTIEVTDKDVTIDVDLGLFERLLPATKVKQEISSRVRGLLT